MLISDSDTTPPTALPTAVIVSVSWSTSLPLASNVAAAMVRGPAILGDAGQRLGATAVGKSLTAVTAKLALALAVPPWPSETE